jgi:deferrochelatase/peroxidase EfeB
MLERGDIQGLVFSGYARQPFARYWFLRFPSAGAAGWLSRVLSRVTTSDRHERAADRRYNLAFTVSGLRALGLAEEALRTFPQAFVRGMAAPESSRILGDHGENAPPQWEFGGNDATRVDALVLAYGPTSDALDEESDTIEDGFERFGIEAHVEDAYLAEDFRDHLGFRDAGTNPRIGSRWFRRRKDFYDPRVPAGEFVLGYRNAYGRFTPSPRAPVRTSIRRLPPMVDARRAMDLGRNGTFVAVRKLALDVPGFWRFAERSARALEPDAPADGALRFAERLIGRRLDGTALVHRPAGPSPADDSAARNSFGYRTLDDSPALCPIGAHARRANPRDTLGDDARESLATVQKHRLIRRGRLYGPKVDSGLPDAAERGLLFMALCADLERQFEFVKESLLDNPKFGGLTRERDPLVGSPPPDAGDEAETFSLDDAPFRRQVRLERFVRVRGGAYLFMPGLRALAYLAEG